VIIESETIEGSLRATQQALDDLTEDAEGRSADIKAAYGRYREALRIAVKAPTLTTARAAAEAQIDFCEELEQDIAVVQRRVDEEQRELDEEQQALNEMRAAIAKQQEYIDLQRAEADELMFLALDATKH
jgi:DNA repair exonuclease SbcCD ATPase subunit